MKRGNNRHREPRVEHILLRTGGLIRTMRGMQATVELLDGRVVTKHLAYIDGTSPPEFQMTFDVKTLRRGRHELRVLFFARVTNNKQQFAGDRALYLEQNLSPHSQMNAFIELWCEGEEDKANDIITT